MISRTKYHLDDDTIKKIFTKAGIEGITKIAPLGAGEYNAVYEVIANRSYVLKIAPPPDIPVLTYEKDMMKSEVYWYRLISKNTDIRVPEIYFEDYSKEIIPADYFIMEKLPGRQRNEVKMDKAVITKKTAEMVAQIHKISNDKFGYIQNELYDSWYEALCAMIENLIHDAKRAGKRTKRGEKLLQFAHKYKNILEAVPCSMVNYDLWEPNILCTEKNGEIEFSWIDPERSFWGDRIFDFVCLENIIDPLGKKTESIKIYNNASDIKISSDRNSEIRYAFALGLLGVIQEAEKYYRYTPKHFGWWRNVISCAVIYRMAFKVLKNG